MKNSGLTSNHSEQIHARANNTNELDKTITKSLLEKYKPKALYSIENRTDKKNERSAA